MSTVWSALIGLAACIVAAAVVVFALTRARNR
jgi:hypothetical protein